MEPETSTMESLLKKYEKNVDGLLMLTRIAENITQDYEQMVQFIQQFIAAKKERDGENFCLSVDERNHLSVAFKNVVGSRRGSWRTMEQNTDFSGDFKKDYQNIIEVELEKKCRAVLKVIQDDLLPPQKTIDAMKSSSDDSVKDNMVIESTIFYLKMCGDYYRYLAEFKQEDDNIKTNADNHYTTALAIAAEHLPATHPTRLGLVLNASVCKFEILKETEAAKTLAKNGFDQAIQKLDSLNDASYKDSTLIMQLLRDNLTIWGNDQDQGTTED